MDYIVFVHPLPVQPAADWPVSVEKLRALGICEDTSFGVTTVRGEWGFFQIPAPGFPELKVTFFQMAEEGLRKKMLTEIDVILERL